MQFDSGFNVLTGETGAGKSIILDAVMLVLGGRADTAMVRTGCDEAIVEALFRLEPSLQQRLHPLLQDEGLDDEEVESLLLSRELRTNGRSISRVNGRAVNLALLRQVAEPLIDIHGQGEHLSLLQPRAHLPLLDAYAGLQGERAVLAGEVHKLQAIQRELQSLQRDKRAIAQRIELLNFKIQEINALALQPEEEEALRAERTRLANAEQLARHAAEATVLMTGADDDTPSITNLLGSVERAFSQLVRFDPTQETLLNNFQGLSFQFSELAGEVQDYLDQLEFNPQRLNAVEERLEAIGSLKRKYTEDSIADLLAARDRAQEELKTLENSEVRTAELEAEQETYLRQIGRLALALSQKRQEAADKLANSVESHLNELHMEGARFKVAFTMEPDENGVYVETGDWRLETEGLKDAGRRQSAVGSGHSEGEYTASLQSPVSPSRVAFDATGIDRAEFLLSTNPGEPVKPMAKVASGGETARLMLALKTALAQVDETPTLIFDEIDQGIGGRVGDIVGRKLWGLTNGAHHQVIVVTHLPQLAGYGDVHFHVSKQVQEGRTTTAVHSLELGGRVRELAAMLGTESTAAREGAESILRQVKAVKQTAHEGR
jgi:DNA repair protein RecN (Recombination protein N)